MLALKQKTYIISITNKGKKQSFSYLQATFRDTLDFFENVKGMHAGEMVVYFFAHVCNFNDADTAVLDMSDRDIIELYKFIVHTYTKGFIPTDEEKKELEHMKKFNELEDKTKKKAERHVPGPESSFIAFLIKHTNETLESLMSMTYEQIKYINEGLVWNLNEQTEEGRKRNRRLAQFRGVIDGLDEESAKKRANDLMEIIEKAQKAKK